MALTDDLVAYWGFDETSGDAADESGNGHTAVAANSPGTTSGHLDNCRTLAAASSQYFTVTDHADLRTDVGDFAIDGWIYTSAVGVQCYLYQGSGTGAAAFSLYLFSNGVDFFLRASYGAAFTTITISDVTASTWTYVYIDYDSATNTVGTSVNHSPKLLTTLPSALNAPAGNWYLGSRLGSGVYVDGRLDEWARWNRKLTTAERGQRYNGGTGYAYPLTGGSPSSDTPIYTGSFTHASSIDGGTITDLYVAYSYPEGVTDLPIVAAMHGYSGGAYTSDAVMTRMAEYGVFAIGPGMRGRNSASGTHDSSGREIQDIVDGFEYVRSNFSSVVSATKAAITGYSGGGGNALALACKFPDYCSVVVSHFGISDYGYDETFGWYPNGGTTLTDGLGGTPSEVPDAYRSRNAVEAITNFTGGHLYLYHDEDDSTVPDHHTTRISAAMDAGSLTNYDEDITTSLDSPRWNHGNPIVGGSGEPNIQTEATWLAAVVAGTYAPWSVPTSGSVRVIGYCVTKRFELWLGTTSQGGSGGGVDEVADFDFDVTTGAYTITPLTGSMDYHLTVGEHIWSGTASSAVTIGGASSSGLPGHRAPWIGVGIGV